MSAAGPQHTTAVLLERIRAGDDGARDDLVRRVEPMLQRWAHGRLPAALRDEMDTADLVQITLVRTLGRFSSFEPGHAGSFFAYLRQALLNAMRDALRARRSVPEREPAATLDALAAMPGSMLESAVGRDGAIAYEQALARLPLPYQELIVMRFEFGLSFPEMAIELGDDKDNVRMRVNRALRQMTDLLNDGDGESRLD